MTLSINPEQARTVIEFSEDKPGLRDAKAGHTKAMHVDISKLRLAERMEEPDPRGHSNGKIFWRAAFLDINSCAALLSRAITALNGHEFVRDFAGKSDGDFFDSSAPILVGEFDCRDQRGRAKARHVKIAMQKMGGRPHKLHLITFYPYIPLPED